MPSLQTSATAGARRMLSNKNGMPPPRRLPTIFGGVGRCKPLRNEICPMLQNGGHAFANQIVLLPLMKPKLATKF